MNNHMDANVPYPSSRFVETPLSPLKVEISSCVRIFSLPTLTRGKEGNVSTVVTKVAEWHDLYGLYSRIMMGESNFLKYPSSIHYNENC